MKRHLISLLLFSFVLFGCLVSCSNVHQERQQQFKKWSQDNGKVKVLSTTAMINDLVQRIGGEQVDTLTLIQGELDPHSYQLVKGDDEKLIFAQIIFSNGVGLEHGPSLQRHLHDNPKNVSLGDRIVTKNQNLLIHIKGQKDPHIWMDVSLWAQAVPIIVDVLSQKDPDHAQEFKQRGEQLQQEMAQTHEEVKQIMHEVPASQRFLVTSHDAFNYFTRAYLAEESELESGEWQKRFAAPEGLAPESQLSTTDIRDIINHMHEYHIYMLFPESNVSQDSIKKIVQAGREKGIELKIGCCPLYADAMGEPGSEGDTYLKMISYDAKMIASYLKDNKK